ncbi:MAG: hypothetical protein NVS3B28_19760 [Candidatus Velthaea sp.]
MTNMMARTNGSSSLLGDFLGLDPFRGPAGPSGAGYSYGFEINKIENGYTVELPVPGFRPDEIELTLEDRGLTIAGKTERRRFTRALIVPDEIDVDAIDARVEHGMLTIGLAIHPKAQPRKIDVKFTN